jgi:membrane protease YdiL (CAAX protease family)
VPYLVARKIKITPRDLGVQVGNKKIGLILLLVGLVAVPFTSQVGITDPLFQATYPLIRPEAVPTLNGGLMVLGETSYVILYYIPYEFFWRGFAQFPLRKYGKINTFWIILWTTVLSTLLHLPVPPSEIAGAAFIGIVYGWLALRANSIIYGFTHHAVTGVSADVVTAMAINGLL